MIGAALQIAKTDNGLRRLILRTVVAGLLVLLASSLAPAQVRIEPRPTPKPTPPRVAAPRSPARPRVFMEFVAIPAGEFVMGSEAGEGNERPPHPVRITKPFEMGKYEVTQRQWKEVMGDNPSYFPGEDRPIDNISWEKAQEFIRLLNERNDGFLYRLPTEAEWEYACRAEGSGDPGSDLQRVAWYSETSGGRTAPVGSKRPNAWGLHDFYGNVAEWVQDLYDPAYYKQSPTEDPPGPASGTQRAIRGCGFSDEPEDCTASARRSLLPDKGSEYIGFRLVRVARQ